MNKLRLRILVGAFGAFLLTAPVRAEIDGSIWENDAAGAADATPANVPVTAPDVTFSIANNAINFSSGNLYTIGEFLASDPLTTVISGSGELPNTLDNTIFNFTGMVTVNSGETFSAGHDDGLTLIIGGTTVIDAPGETSFVNTTETYNGPAGTFPFQLVYGECCGAPADLAVSGLNLVSSTPEPSSVALTFSMLLVLGFMLRKRFGKAL